MKNRPSYRGNYHRDPPLRGVFISQTVISLERFPPTITTEAGRGRRACIGGCTYRGRGGDPDDLALRANVAFTRVHVETKSFASFGVEEATNRAFSLLGSTFSPLKSAELGRREQNFRQKIKIERGGDSSLAPGSVRMALDRAGIALGASRSTRRSCCSHLGGVRRSGENDRELRRERGGRQREGGREGGREGERERDYASAPRTPQPPPLPPPLYHPSGGPSSPARREARGTSE